LSDPGAQGGAAGPPADLLVREAREEDLSAIIALFADDTLGGHGDTVDGSAREEYLAAFRWIENSPNDTLFVAETSGEVVGTFQTSLTRTMPGRGSAFLTIAAVQTRSDLRGRGIGAAMIAHAVQVARATGARYVQLTSNMVRSDAHRFYERLGFARTHFGFKMKL
jgi:GNAT superfamily N-acetyltransferase